MQGGALHGVDELRSRRIVRGLVMAAFALLLMLAVVVTPPTDRSTVAHTASVGVAREVTDTVATRSDGSAQAHSDNTAVKELTIAVGTIAMASVVGLALSRRAPRMFGRK